MVDLRTRCSTPFGVVHSRLGQFTFIAKFPKGFVPCHLDGEPVLTPLKVLVMEREGSGGKRWVIAQVSEPEADYSPVYLEEESLAIVNSQYKGQLNLALDYVKTLESRTTSIS